MPTVVTQSMAKKAWDHGKKGKPYYDAMTEEQKRAMWQYGKDNGLIDTSKLGPGASAEYKKYVISANMYGKSSNPVQNLNVIDPDKATKSGAYADYGYTDPITGEVTKPKPTYAPQTTPIKLSVKDRQLEDYDGLPKSIPQKTKPQKPKNPTLVYRGGDTRTQQQKFAQNVKEAQTPLGALGVGIGDSSSFYTDQSDQANKTRELAKQQIAIKGGKFKSVTNPRNLNTGMSGSKPIDVNAKDVSYYDVGNVIGTLAPYAGLENIAGKAVTRFAPKLAEGIGKQVVKGAIAGSVQQGVSDVAQGKTAEETLKDVLLGAGLGALADIGLGAFSKALQGRIAKEGMTDAVKNEMKREIGQFKIDADGNVYKNGQFIRKTQKGGGGDVVQAEGSKFVDQYGNVKGEAQPTELLNEPLKPIELTTLEKNALNMPKVKNLISPTVPKDIPQEYIDEYLDYIGEAEQQWLNQSRLVPETKTVSFRDKDGNIVNVNKTIQPQLNTIQPPLVQSIGKQTEPKRIVLNSTGLFKGKVNDINTLKQAKQNAIEKTKQPTMYDLAKGRKETPNSMTIEEARLLKPISQPIQAPSLNRTNVLDQTVNEAQKPLKTDLNKLKDDAVYNDLAKELEGVSTNTDTNIHNIAIDVKDKSGLKLNMKDIYRNMRDAFGKHYDYVKKNYLDPFDASKKSYVDEVKANTDNIYNKVVKGLGIKKGSKESAAVQWYGEGVKVVDGKEIPYSKDDLIRDFGQNTANKIIEADTVFRQAYDNLVGRINATKKQIYPNVENEVAKIKDAEQALKAQKTILVNDTTLSADAKKSALKIIDDQLADIPRQIDDSTKNKRLIPRKDYYRHFNEMAQGFEGLRNIFDTPSQIDPKLAGISPFTQPKSKWASFMQHRGEGKYKADAVGGFLDYIQPAAYSIHIDPHINNFRSLAKDLAEATVDTKNANNTIEYLRDFANSLAGKTNEMDRVVQKLIPGGRTAMRGLNWLNGRIKANQVVGNLSSSLSQLANVPAGMAKIKSPTAVLKGGYSTISEIIGKGNPAIKQSQFINERYINDLLTRFNVKMLDKTQGLAGWTLQAGDKLGTLLTWNSAYYKAVENGISDPVKYADELTRSIVAGRGIGEVPLLQQSKTFQLIAPFQLEVANLWHTMGDSISEKDFAYIPLLLLGNYIFNNATEKATGNRVTFDPVDVVVESIKQSDNLGKIIGRMTGEVLSNVPLGQTLAAQYPEYGADITTPMGTKKIPTRKDLFGDNDPTRMGGGLLVAKGLTDPLYKILPPFGGSQAKKTIEGLTAYNKGMVEKNGKMNFPVTKNIPNAIKSAAFGKYSTSDAREYFDKDRRPLSEKQTQAVLKQSDTKKAYDDMIKQRELDKLKKELSALEKDDTLTLTEKYKKRLEIYQKMKDLK